MTQPRIVFVTRKWAPALGGMETYSHRLTDALGEIEPVETIALPGKSDGMPPSASSLLLFPLTVFRRLLARRWPPEILHVGDMALWPLGLAVYLGLARRIAISAHGTDVAYHRRGGWRGWLYGQYLKLGAKLLPQARVIANSQATAHVASETGWRATAVIPLATDHDDSAASDDPHDNSILFAGRLVERKGCGWFIREVLPLLPGDTRLAVAGTGWDERERTALAAPGVDFLGPLHGDALREQYRRALCVVVPNIEPASGEFEGFGLVAPEAASAGGVVLAARCGGLTNAVIDGETGLLIESGNSGAWASMIAEVSAWAPEKRKAFLAHSQRTARKHYSWARVARETFEAYDLDKGMRQSVTGKVALR